MKLDHLLKTKILFGLIGHLPRIPSKRFKESIDAI